MELTIKPSPVNQYPSGGVLVKGHDITIWLQQMQAMELNPAETELYPIPGAAANSLWGCLLVPRQGAARVAAGKNSYCQLVQGCLFIPAFAAVYPVITHEEAVRLLGNGLHLYHPETGLLTLPDALAWERLFTAPVAAVAEVTTAVKGVYLPQTIRRFQVALVSPEEALQQMEQTFPEPEVMERRPLSFFEKIKLALMRPFFSGKEGGKFRELLSRVPALDKWAAKMEQAVADLEDRNKEQVDKLLEMLQNDPDEALKYAVPLDREGSGRGTADGAGSMLSLGQRWDNLSLGGGMQGLGGGGSSVLGSDLFMRLQQQYEQTARDLIARGEYEKAAFVYLKLLNDHAMASKTLEEGRLYAQAAALYLQKDKRSDAARCYAKGKMYQRAIELYAETGHLEEAAELCLVTGNKEGAHYFYGKAADEYITKKQYLTAGGIYRDKLEDISGAKELMMEGWRSGIDAVNCINSYFDMIPDEPSLEKAMRKVYEKETTGRNNNMFLAVLKTRYIQHPSIGPSVRDMAYEIIASRIKKEPVISAELEHFNKQDKKLVKDILLYKAVRR